MRYLIGLLLLTGSLHGRPLSIADRTGETIYQIELPDGWTYETADPTSDLSDSRLPLAIFHREGVELHLHNFPTETLEQRIPPQAQLQRWQQQMELAPGRPLIITPLAFGGYAGLHIDAEGRRNGSPYALLAWSLLLDREHYRTLARQEKTEQKRADITLKATGSPDSIQRYADEIRQIAESFELIDGIPMRL